jgi:hypothetical protein
MIIEISLRHEHLHQGRESCTLCPYLSPWQWKESDKSKDTEIDRIYNGKRDLSYR